MFSSTTYQSELSAFTSVSLDEINDLSFLRRFDSKYVIPIDDLSILLKTVCPYYKILQINGERCFSYTTEYYDTPDLSCYINHQNGRSNRYKIRHRHYHVNDLDFLELKMKNNKGRTIKKRIEIENVGLDVPKYEFLEQYVDLSERNLIKTASNTFCRITLVSFEFRERITIDFDLAFSSSVDEKSLPYFAIAEIKSGKKYQRTPFSNALRKLSVRPRGFSKYCMSMAMLNPALKQNSFKSNLLLLKKLKYAKYDA